MEKEDKKFQYIMNRIEKAEGWRDANFKDTWKEYYRRWRSQPEAATSGKSNIFVPMTFMLADVISSRISEGLFATRPCVTVLPRKTEFKDAADKIQVLLDWQMAERMRIARLFSDDVIPSLTTFGTAITHTAWLKKTHKQKRRQTVNEPLLDDLGNERIDNESGEPLFTTHREEVEESTVVYDDPYVQKIDLFCFFVDPQASNLENARYCGHKEYRTRSELEMLEKQKEYKINWEDVSPATEIQSGVNIRLDKSGKNQEREDSADFDKSALYEVHHYWEEEKHIVILDRQQIILDEGNPFFHGYLPYDRVCYIPLPGEFYGMGVVELVSALQDELNTSRNQRIDYNSMVLRRMWKLRKGCGLTAKDLVWRQNGVLQLENMDDVQEINVQDLPASAFKNEAEIKQDMKDATGCHDILMGLAQYDETATTTMTKDNNASIRFKKVSKDISDDLLLMIAQKCVSLDQQFMTEERMIRVSENPEQSNEITYQYVSPLEIEGEFDLIYVGTSTDPMANKETQKTRLMEAINILWQDPAYQADFEARTEMYKRLFEAMGLEAIDDLLPQPPAPPSPVSQGGLMAGMVPQGGM